MQRRKRIPLQEEREAFSNEGIHSLFRNQQLGLDHPRPRDDHFGPTMALAGKGEEEEVHRGHHSSGHFTHQFWHHHLVHGTNIATPASLDGAPADTLVKTSCVRRAPSALPRTPYCSPATSLFTFLLSWRQHPRKNTNARSVCGISKPHDKCAADGYGAINRLYPPDSRSVTQLDLGVN